MKKQIKTNGWNDERKTVQRSRYLVQKSWESSIGPQTTNVKTKSEQNSYKTGAIDAGMVRLQDVLTR